VVDDDFRDDTQAAAMCFFEELLEVLQCAVSGVDVGVIGDVVAIVLPRRRGERQ
jgi:hypothetical protein